jgi:hypothetical protein
MNGWMRMGFMIENEVRRVGGSWEFGVRSAVSFFGPFCSMRFGGTSVWVRNVWEFHAGISFLFFSFEGGAL